MYIKNISIIIVIIILIQISALAPKIEARGSFLRDGKIVAWGENWYPPQAKLELNLIGKASLGEYSRLQFVVEDMLEKGRKDYYLSLGLGFKYKSFVFEPTLGWSWLGIPSQKNQFIGMFRVYNDSKYQRSYFSVEYQAINKVLYNLSQFEFKVNSFLECGFEGEAWVNLKDNLSSKGIGLNCILNFEALYPDFKENNSKLRLELAVQYREMDGKLKPQAIVRFSFSSNAR